MSDIAKVKEIRERTDAGFGACKSALKEASGDIEVAIDIIRKRSAAKASTKLDRQASEGRIVFAVSEDRKSGSIVEVNVETDFASRHERFDEFCGNVAQRAIELGSRVIQEMDDERRAFIGIIGENVRIRRAQNLSSSDGVVGGYVHVNHEYGAIVELSGGNEKLAADIALHVTAMRPLAVSGDDLPREVLERERSISRERALESGKPEKIVDRIVEGQLRRFLSESSMLDQSFVLDEDLSVGRHLKSHGVECRRFVRFQRGEGEAQDLPASDVR